MDNEFEGKVVGIDTDYAPDLAEIPLRNTNSPDGEKYLIIYTSSNETDDLKLSIVPDNDYFNALIAENNLQVVAEGKSNISLSALAYGLQHTERTMYRSTMQDINYFITNNIISRFEKDDEFLRTELNKLG